MKGRKGSDDEGGRPLAAAGPLAGAMPAGTVVTPIAAAIDLYPTLADLAGIERVGDKPFDGISLAPWLLGKGGDAPDRVLFQHWAGRASARDQRYRLDAAGQLSTWSTDPRQTKNIAAEHPRSRSGSRRRSLAGSATCSPSFLAAGRPAVPGRLRRVPPDRAAGPRRRPARRREAERSRPELLLLHALDEPRTTASPGRSRSTPPAATRRSSTTRARRPTWGRSWN